MVAYNSAARTHSRELLPLRRLVARDAELLEGRNAVVIVDRNSFTPARSRPLAPRAFSFRQFRDELARALRCANPYIHGAQFGVVPRPFRGSALIPCERRKAAISTKVPWRNLFLSKPRAASSRSTLLPVSWGRVFASRMIGLF